MSTQGSHGQGGQAGITRPRLAVLLFLALLSTWVGIHIYRWGRPVPQAYRPAGQNRWTGPDGKTIEARDQDSDGTWDRYVSGRASFGHGPGEAGAAAPARQLVLCVDGVPYDVVRQVWEQGHFREFFRPVEMISTFPSESEVAMTAILHAPTAPGYENQFFSRSKGRIVGGVGVTLAQEAPYLKKLDYDQSGLFKGIHYILPTKTYRADLGRFRKRFLESAKPVYVAHISSTDGLYHVYPEARVRGLLLELEPVLRDLFLAARGGLRILLFSDHGNNLALSRPAPLREAVERAGFKWKSRLNEERAVVIPQYGLVSFAAVYARPEVHEELARVLASAEGVEMVAYREKGRDGQGKIRVVARSASAVLEGLPDGSRLAYRPEQGDPLALVPAIESLKAAGKLDANGFAAASDWFAATLDARFPDAVFRLFEWSSEAHSYVENRSDLIVSLADGYYSGSALFSRFVTLHSTHGGLGRGTTMGFAMATDKAFGGAVRYDMLLK